MAEAPPGFEKKRKLLERGASIEEVEAWESTTRERLVAKGASEAEINNYFGVGPLDAKAINDPFTTPKVVDKEGDEPRRPRNFGEAFQAGVQVSLTGLATRGKAPDIAVGKADNFFFKIASAMGTFVGDAPIVLPTYAATFAPGAKIGAAASASSRNPVAIGVGTAAGGLAFAGGVSGFVSADLRESMLKFYEDNEGRNVTKQDFIAGVSANALKLEVLDKAFGEGASGAFGGLIAGPLGARFAGQPVVREVAVGASEMLGSVTFATALSGELPDPTDLGAALTIAVGAGAAAGRIETGVQASRATRTVREAADRRIKKRFVRDGGKPEDMVKRAQADAFDNEKLLLGTNDVEPDTTYVDIPGNPEAGFPADDRLRIPHEKVDKEYVEGAPTAWSALVRANEGKGGGDGPPIDPNAPAFGKQDRLPPPGAETATQADIDAVLDIIRPGKRRKMQDIDDIRFETVDDLQYVISAPRQAFKAAFGKDLSPLENPGEQMALARGAHAIAEQEIQRGVFDPETGEKIAPSLNDVMKQLKSPAERRAWRAYLTAKRGIEKFDQGFEVGMDEKQIAAARRVVASAERNDIVIELRDMKRDWDKAGIDRLLRSGLMSEKGARRILEQNEDFVPFHAADKDNNFPHRTRGFPTRNPTKKFKGGDIKIADPIEASIKNRFYYVQMAENNLAKTRLVKFNSGRLPRQFRFLKRVTPAKRLKKQKPIDAEFEDIIDLEARDIPETFQELDTDVDPGVKRLPDLSKEQQDRINERFQNEDIDTDRQIVLSNEDGSVDIFNIEDIARDNSEIARWMEENGLGAEDLTWLHVMPELEQRLFKRGDFVVFEDGQPIVYRASDPRLVRSLERLTPSDMNLLVKVLSVPAKAFRAGVTAFPGFQISAMIRDTIDAALINKAGVTPVITTVNGAIKTLAKTAEFEKFVANGGANTALIDIDANILQKNLMAFDDRPDILVKSRKALNTAYRALYAWGAASDQFTRVGVSASSKSGARTPRQKALAGRQVSLDFARVGAGMRALNLIVPFLGPAINGIDRSILAAKRHPRELFIAGAAFVTLPTIILWAAFSDEPWYQELTDEEKARGWWLRVGGTPEDPDIVTIPKPHAWVSLLSNIPELILNTAKKDNPKLAQSMMESLEREFLLDPADFAGVSALKDVASNHNSFTDRPIVSKRMEDNLLPVYRYTPYTSQAAKNLARILPPVVPERFRAPVALDFLFNSIVGTSGRNILTDVENVLGKIGAIEKTPTSRDEIVDNALVRRFFQAGPRSRRTIDEFFENADRAGQLRGSYKELIRQGKIDEAGKLAREQGAFMMQTQRAEAAIGTIFTAIRMIEFSDKYGPEEKQQLVDQYMSFAASLAGAYNEQVVATRKAVKEQKKEQEQ